LGDTPLRERKQVIDDFQQKRDPHIIIAHPETIAESQNLTAASTALWYAPIDKTNIYLQGNKRHHRPGQQRSCVVVNLFATPTEKEIYRRLANNESMQGLLLRMVEDQRL
jgi:SNF2 family DNA or RNA helicase